MFSEEVNRELLDIVTSVVTGDRTAEEAADALQTAWEFSH
jgi:galactose-1-phosphate uridylyltransferase